MRCRSQWQRIEYRSILRGIGYPRKVSTPIQDTATSGNPECEPPSMCTPACINQARHAGTPETRGTSLYGGDRARHGVQRCEKVVLCRSIMLTASNGAEAKSVSNQAGAANVLPTCLMYQWRGRASRFAATVRRVADELDFEISQMADCLARSVSPVS